MPLFDFTQPFIPVFPPRPATRPNYPLSNSFVSARGHAYPIWGTDDSRSAITPGDLIENPVYQIESIFRDVLFREWGLVMEAGSNATTVVCQRLIGTTADYYDGAYVQNYYWNRIHAVESYNPLTKTLTVADSGDLDPATGYNFAVFNIRGSNQIHYAAFDIAAAARTSWKGAFSIFQKVNSFEMVAQLAREFGLLWFRDSLNREVIRAIETTSPDLQITDDDISIIGGFMPQIRIYQTPTDDIYNEFTVNYKYSYVTGGWDETLTLKPRETSIDPDTRTGFRDGYESYQELVQASQETYKIKRPLEIPLYAIRDEATAILKLKQMANLYALPAYIIEADLVMNANTVKLEEGDFVTFDHELLPTALNDGAVFVCVDWSENPQTQTYHVVFRELPWE